MNAVCVDPKRINEVWPHFKHLIDRAISKIGISDFRWVEKEVLEGRCLLWLACEGTVVYAAAVTQLVNGYCNILACSGNNLNLFVDCIEALEDFARAEKCKGMLIYGRKGWERVLKNYKAKAIILEKVL